MESAPAAIPATIEETFAVAFAPHDPLTVTCSPTQHAQPTAFGQPHHRRRPTISGQVLLIENRVGPAGSMQKLRLRGAHSMWPMEA